MRVLLADFDSARAKRHSEACVARGYVVDGARHGASALELALERVPDVVVCPVDLPVIDGERLAGILRGNPRTRHASFVFLVKDELDAPMAIDPRDGTVVDPWHDEDVLDHIDALIERTSRYGEARGDTEIEGKLTQISLVDLLQIFQMNKRSGTLRIWRSDGVGSGSILVRSGHVLDASVPLADGTCIVGEKAVYRLLAWKEGRFEFAPGSVSEAKRVEKPTRGLLLEAMRQMDEWESLRSELPAADARVALQVPPERVPGIEQALTAEVVQAVETYRRVGEVVDHCSFPDYQVLHTLHTLAGREIISVRRSSVVTPTLVAGDVEAEGDGLFDEAQVRRVREWLQQGPANGVTRTSAKLLVASTERDVADFARLLAYVPGASLSDEMREGRIGEDDLATIGRIAVDESIHIELIHVPLGERAAPLWPLAASGALGTLFLLSGSISEVAERLKPMSDVLRRLPKSRIFHVILLRKGERISPEELKRNLSLIDEASLFLLPLDSAKAPSALLRSLFFRVVP